MPEKPQDLSQHRCLYARTLVGGNRWCFEFQANVEIVTICDTLECDNSEMLLDLALEHAGIAYLPHSLVSDSIERGSLFISCKITNVPVSISICFIVHAHQCQSVAVVSKNTSIDE